jgi:hypothetical protein
VIRRLFRIGLLLGLLGGIAFALTKLLSNQTADAPALPARPSEPWPRLASDPTVAAPPIARLIPDSLAPAAENAPEKKAPAKIWVEPSGGVCPTSHPVKAKLASKIFHMPGGANYERTSPDRCYADAASAEVDGLRAAKR